MHNYESRTFLKSSKFVLFHNFSFFSVAASNGFRPNSNFNVAVSSHGYKESIDIKVGIKTSTGKVIVSADVTVKPFSTKNVVLSIPDVSTDSYLLFAKSIDFGSTYKEAPIVFLSKLSSTFIQTDKATYKPNDVINFRCIILDSSLKSFDTTKVFNQIYVLDPNGNRIKQYDNVTFVSGVYKNKILLTENPPIGTWTIVVVLNGVSTSDQFVVEKYVLPTFSVDVKTIPQVSFADGKITATINSKYTYGQNVNGILLVNVYRAPYIGASDKTNLVLKSQYKEFDGSKVVEYSFAQLNSENYQTDFIIEATVEEGLTGKKSTNQGIVTVHQYSYKMEITGESDFKPNFTYEGDVTITNWDGSPFTDSSADVTITVTNVNTYYWYSPPEPYSNTFNVSIKNGIAHFEFKTPVSYETLRITANYKQLPSYSLQINKDDNGINEYIQLKIGTIDLHPKGCLDVSVVGTKKLQRLTYIVLARGNIVSSKTVKIKKLYSATFRIKLSYSMVPSATILAFYVSDYGVFVSDSLKLNLPKVYHNYLKIDIENEIVKPGSKVDIGIQTRPHSYVGIMGVDQSVLLLRSGNDLDTDTIFGTMILYEGATRTNSSYPEFYVS